jgi:hypothetical protein
VVEMAATWLDTLNDAYGEIKRHGEAWIHATGYVPPTLLKGTVTVSGTPFPLLSEAA